MTTLDKGATLLRWSDANTLHGAEPVVVFDSDGLPEELVGVSVVSRTGGRERVIELVGRGADQVLIGEPALLVSELIKTLSAELGAGKVGVWVPARRRKVSWTLDLVSNNDFKCLTPSYGKASWEILMNDGTETGTDVEWWIAQMFELGASRALLGVDIEDDGDLNICAGLVERFGASLWLTPLMQPEADLLPWIRLGQARNLVVPALQYADEARMLALNQALALPDEQKIEAEPAKEDIA
ncbi:MAG: hypothetical protein ABI479_06275 [Gallionella sp.]